MAKQTSAEAAYNKTLLQIQQSANNSAKTIQEMVNKSNKEQMQFNKQEAATAREWEKQMSNTSHQREVADLKKSGLNPVLSVNSGAQSYTTAAASTNNDSGASATGAVLEGQLGAIANLESSRMSSQATLSAAKQSAAAQRYAAKQAAAASVYHSNVQNEINKRTTAAQKWIATNKQPGGLFAFIDKQLTQTGGNKLIKKLAKPFAKKFEQAFKTPAKFFKNSGKITMNNFKLNKVGQGMFDSLNRKAGLKPTVANRRLAVRAFMFQDSKSLRLYNSRVQAARVTVVTPHHGYTTVQRSGHR